MPQKIMKTLSLLLKTLSPLSFHLAVFASLVFSPLSHAQMVTGNYTFQFDRSGTPIPDRDYNFGSRPTTGQFDVNNVATFQAQSSGPTGLFRGQVAETSTWALLNDPQPDIINATPPTGSADFIVSSTATLTLRTRVIGLSSGTGGDPGYGGFVFSLDGTGSTASGFAAVLRRTPGNNAISGLEIRNFTSGTLGSVVASSANFNYGGGIVFLSLSASANSFSFSAFADSDITGSGNDASRLSSASFGSATPLASVSGLALSGYGDGYTGILFTDVGAAQGNFDVGNFQLAVIPEPTVAAMFLMGLGLIVMAHRRCRAASLRA